ncbi:VOC family protein [Bradyrhizobium sp. DASA03068]|uniref:VOC family protein n=1 Tax=Bradyrhizobium sp. BLXBL-01 TaxID=3395915 RepID=UPI003F6F9792
MLPAEDLERARAFYSEKLGLDPVEQREGGLRYVCVSGEFAIFISAGCNPAAYADGLGSRGYRRNSARTSRAGSQVRGI